MKHSKTFPRVLVSLALLCASILFTPNFASATSNSEKCLITFELKQSRWSLDIWKHAKDAMNAIDIKLPVDCDFYDEVHVGDNVLNESFRAGSF